MTSEHLYEMTQADGPLDLRVLIVMGPTAYGWRQQSISYWGVGWAGRPVNEQIRDRTRIKLFLVRVNKAKRRKENQLLVKWVWASDTGNQPPYRAPAGG